MYDLFTYLSLSYSPFLTVRDLSFCNFCVCFRSLCFLSVYDLCTFLSLSYSPSCLRVTSASTCLWVTLTSCLRITCVSVCFWEFFCLFACYLYFYLLWVTLTFFCVTVLTVTFWRARLKIRWWNLNHRRHHSKLNLADLFHFFTTPCFRCWKNLAVSNTTRDSRTTIFKYCITCWRT